MKLEDFFSNKNILSRAHPALNLSLTESGLKELEALLKAAGIQYWRHNQSSVEETSFTNKSGPGNNPFLFGDGSVSGISPINDHNPDQLVDVCAGQSSLYVDYTQKVVVRNIFIVLYTVVAALSLTGNLMVIWTVWKKRHMRTVTDYYILNLAVSDFLIALFVVPLKLLEYTAPCSWQVFSNDALCSALSFVLPVFVFASVFTLVAISLERHYAIVHPLSSIKIHCKSRTRWIIALTWIAAILMAGPYLYYKSYPFVIYSHLGSLNRQICTDRFDEIDFAVYKTSDRSVQGRFRKFFFLFLFVTIYLLPLIIILTTSVRIAICLLEPIAVIDPQENRYSIRRKREETKRKVALMMIVVAAGFVISWTPFYLITFISQVQKKSFLRESNYIFTMLLIHWLGFLNSCFNPIIYNFMNDKFHRSFRQFLNMCRPRWLIPDRSASARWTRVSLTPRHGPQRPYPLASYLKRITKRETQDLANRVTAPECIELQELNGGLETNKRVTSIQRRCSSSPMPGSSRSKSHSSSDRVSDKRTRVKQNYQSRY